MKEINKTGDYYSCIKCKKWHKYSEEKGKLGNRHIIYFDKEQSNSDDAEYYYCGLHKEWHGRDRKCIQYRTELIIPESIEKSAQIKIVQEKEEQAKVKKKQGYYTALLGKKLYEWNSKNEKLKVFYDHGDSTLTEVGEPTPFFGESYRNYTTLSNIDIMVVNPVTKTIELLVEIEESKVPPKTIIGEIFNILFANKIRFNNQDYVFRNTNFLLMLNVKFSNDRKKKAEGLLNEIKTIKGILERNGYSNNVSEIEILYVDEKKQIPDIGFKEITKMLS